MNDLDADARRILRLARAARSPSAADQARVARRIALASAVAAAGVAVSAGTAKAAKATALWGGAKLWIASGVLLSAAIGGYLGLSPVSPQPSAARHPPPVSVRAPSAAPAPAPAPDLPAAAPPAPRRPERQVPPSTLPEELELLHAAQRAWRTRDSQRALELVQGHRQRYPRSQLRSERDALEVLARCELGRDARSLALAKKLLAREPRSPSRAAIEQSCGF